MEKRLIIAFILSFLVLYGFQALFTPPPQPPPDAGVTAQPSAPSPGSTPAAPATAAPPTPSDITELSSTPPAEEVRAELPEDFVFDNTQYVATVSNVGGTLRSYKLKSYTDGEGLPLDLINAGAGQKVGWPLVLVTGNAEVDKLLAEAPFVGTRERTGETERLFLEFAGSGVHATKTLQFDPIKFEFSLETFVSKDGKSVPHTVAWQGDFGDQSIPRDPVQRNAVYYADMAYTRVNVGSIETRQNLLSTRAGVEDQYFLAMFLSPDAPVPVQIEKEELAGEDGETVATVLLNVASPAGKAMRLYVGPKERMQLSLVDPQLEAVIDYGWFEFVAKPLIAGLLWLHSYIGNFGWAIIILTVAINIVLFPLRLKQQVSMLKMQKIQPQMRRLQDQYKKLKPNDPRKAQVQSEMMGLYKQHGVNPMGGCLPLLLQMPVLFGFYSALYYSIELRRAPWMLWINDLSRYDPYFVLPILMALSMIAMTKLTPTTVDPMQAKMMMIMPVMFTVLFIYQSSGLVLYWLTSNVAGIGQQVFINKYWTPQTEKKLSSRSKGKELPEK